MPCKTRQAALRGERSKPHFYLPYSKSRVFAWVLPFGVLNAYSEQHARALLRFEARIDWSTWGASR